MAYLDLGPVQDALGHAEVDLYDASGNQRGTVSNPFSIAQVDSPRVTYSVATVGFAFATTAPTDIFTIAGSTTKIIRIIRLEFVGIQTTAAQKDVLLIKRSSNNNGGTYTNAAGGVVKYDSNDVAPTANVLVYTANPTTLGTQVGILRAGKIFIGTTATDSETYAQDFGVNNSKPLILRGSAEMLAINLNGVTTLGGSAAISVTWTEDTV